MDDSYRLNTPEQVELAYEVAGLGSRFMAALVDGAIQAAVVAAAWIAAGLGGVLAQRVTAEWFGLRGSTAMMAMLGLMVLLLFVVTWGYYVFFELVWNGQSPGKRVMGIRVMTTGGQAITLTHSLIRNLVRLVDMLPTSYALGIVVMLLNSRAQRLGDLAAGTVVVKERSAPSPRMLPDLAADLALPPQQAAAFTAEDVALARDFLLRRADLEPARRRELAEQIAGRLRARLDPTIPLEPAETLLARVAAIRR